MDRKLTRCAGAMLLGALGIATVAAIASLPPGTGHGNPGALALAISGSPPGGMG